jgi:nitronate monooxygenase
MGVLSNADDLIATGVREGIPMIVAGASLPLRLPGQADDPAINLVPIVSSGRAAALVLRAWDKRYGRCADGIILEGPRAGGHLGFSLDELERMEDFSLQRLLAEVLEAIKPYEDKYARKIPVVAGGGVFTGKDIANLLRAGASGVQMATRFVGTVECDVAPAFKQAYLDATRDDIVIIKSPVGLPGRAIRNRFIKDVEARGKLDIRCLYRCLSTCDVQNAKYCIAQALVNACVGDVDHGLIFCGENAYRVNAIVTVKELMAELEAEIKAELEAS